MKLSISSLSIALLVLLFGCNETMTSRYTNFQIAEEAILFNRGWFPNVLPVDSGQIVETHNIDRKQRCAESVVPADSLSIIEAEPKQQKVVRVEEKMAEPPFSPNECPFKLKKIIPDRSAFSKATEIVVLDKETNKRNYWSF